MRPPRLNIDKKLSLLISYITHFLSLFLSLTRSNTHRHTHTRSYTHLFDDLTANTFAPTHPIRKHHLINLLLCLSILSMFLTHYCLFLSLSHSHIITIHQFRLRQKSEGDRDKQRVRKWVLALVVLKIGNSKSI